MCEYSKNIGYLGVNPDRQGSIERRSRPKYLYFNLKSAYLSLFLTLQSERMSTFPMELNALPSDLPDYISIVVENEGQYEVQEPATTGKELALDLISFIELMTKNCHLKT